MQYWKPESMREMLAEDFHKVQTVDDFYSFLEGPIADSLFHETSLLDNSELLTGSGNMGKTAPRRDVDDERI